MSNFHNIFQLLCSFLIVGVWSSIIFKANFHKLFGTQWVDDYFSWLATFLHKFVFQEILEPRSPIWVRPLWCSIPPPKFLHLKTPNTLKFYWFLVIHKPLFKPHHFIIFQMYTLKFYPPQTTQFLKFHPQTVFPLGGPTLWVLPLKPHHLLAPHLLMFTIKLQPLKILLVSNLSADHRRMSHPVSISKTQIFLVKTPRIFSHLHTAHPLKFYPLKLTQISIPTQFISIVQLTWVMPFTRVLYFNHKHKMLTQLPLTHYCPPPI